MKTDTLKQLYRSMLLIRRVEEKIVQLYPEQEMRCPVHLCIGQEAIPAGVCAALRPQDYILSYHRSHGHYLAKGGNLKILLAELWGKATGCSGGYGGSMHLVDLEAGFLGSTPIVASTIPIAVGVAFGVFLKGEDRTTVVFFGDAAVEEGVFHESLNFAALHGLPILFVCENNFYSVHSPLSVRQPKGNEIIQLAKGHGMDARQGDGNDAMKVLETAQQALGRIRDTKGPQFLEFKTYRWRGHCGPNEDEDLGVRSREELRVWQSRCPIRKLEKLLLDRRILKRQELEGIAQEIDEAIEEAVVFAKSSPFPAKDVLLTHSHVD